MIEPPEVSNRSRSPGSRRHALLVPRLFDRRGGRRCNARRPRHPRAAGGAVDAVTAADRPGGPGPTRRKWGRAAADAEGAALNRAVTSRRRCFSTTDPASAQTDVLVWAESAHPQPLKATRVILRHARERHSSAQSSPGALWRWPVHGTSAFLLRSQCGSLFAIWIPASRIGSLDPSVRTCLIEPRLAKFCPRSPATSPRLALVRLGRASLPGWNWTSGARCLVGDLMFE